MIDPGRNQEDVRRASTTVCLVVLGVMPYGWRGG